ncbi:GDSL-like Lipase/Acylhydrolase family protein [Chitinophaga terrae (ex Kim and Jung 2007)]|uniref:GDSL-like Lipase/Acylhydrolase family protein n=1 Tax=Chitinophaga terrae (ex Kim and Jung 2007) TaxID=408074 RepID=A0A1H4EHF8_9BACT|nr:SGNH/GDSL hydrolase family protein [Chitinophaga terrae (ex Kim and Jung 2007)]SEA84020.1 GDSL-like Lipase/Acylhydrolase family protein [Chitinophaga terrae (ex Kim and Jung 2007)]
MIRSFCSVIFSICLAVSAMAQQRFISQYGDLNNTLYHLKEDKKVTVTFLGGSITNMTGWRDQVGDYLRAAYPHTRWTFNNAGIPSLGSLPHSFRFGRDVAELGKTDLLFLEAAVNDQVNETNEITQRRAMEGIIRHALAVNPEMNIVLMAFVDEDKMADYRAGKIPLEVRVHEDMAKKYHLPFINLAKEVTTRIDAGEFTWKEDFKDLHPSPFGQTLYFNTIKVLLDEAFSKPAPAKLVAAKLPKPADKFNYEKGKYADIHQAKIIRGFRIDERWKPADNVGTREGFVNVPMLVSDSANAVVEFPFTGRAVGIAIVSGPDAGTISYSIDNGPVQTKNTHTQWSNGLYLPWYLLLGDGLTAGPHTLRIETGGGKEVCRIVYFLVNE